MQYEKFICAGAFVILMSYLIYHIVNAYLDSSQKTPQTITKTRLHYPLVAFREKLIFQDNENYMFLFVENNSNITLGKIPKNSTTIIDIAKNQEPYLEETIITSNYLSRRKSSPKNFVSFDFKYVLHCSSKLISDISTL